MIIRAKGSIEDKIKLEREQRAAIRKQEDQHRGLSRSSGPQRGDFNQCKKFDKILGEYRRFKNPNDRKKIESNYRQSQKEARHG